MLVPYENLIETMTAKVLPMHFHLQLSGAGLKRVEEVGGVYSKARKPGKEWVEDSGVKEETASKSVLRASNEILRPVYDQMLAV